MATNTDVKIDEKIKRKFKEPSKYKVVFLNDNNTPMDWVVMVLMDIFKHSRTTAEKIMLTVHNDGSAVVGVYSHEIAEQKAVDTITASRRHGFPLQIDIEEDK